MQSTVERADHFISLELTLVPEKEFYVLSWLVQSFRYSTFCILQKNIRQFILRKTYKCCSISKDWTRGRLILSKPPILLKMFVLREMIFESVCLAMSWAQLPGMVALHIGKGTKSCNWEWRGGCLTVNRKMMSLN